MKPSVWVWKFLERRDSALIFPFIEIELTMSGFLIEGFDINVDMGMECDT